MLEERNARMYDEHRPPQLGIETKIMEELSTERTTLARELIAKMESQGFLGLEITDRIWSLIDRGYIELTTDRRLRRRTRPIDSALVEFL